MGKDMNDDRYFIFLNQARGGYFYIQERSTRKQESLGTKDETTAKRLLHARNEATRLPAINRQIAHAYLRAADPKMITRTWQEVMDAIVAQKHGETQRRWLVAIRDHAYDAIRQRPLIETAAEELLNVVKRGSICTNVYLRRLHNFALDMDWLLKATVPKRQWPKVVHRKGNAIKGDEHRRIVEREQNPERRAFYELLWHMGGSQSDVACLYAKDVDWQTRTITYSRKKLLSRGVDPASIRFGDEVAQILKQLPQHGPLFPYLRTVRAGDRSTEFKQRCTGLGIKGISLHSYRYAWAQRAAEAGYPERWAQQALGHGSKAVHRAYARRAEATVPTPEAWLKEIEARACKEAGEKILKLEFDRVAAGKVQAN
jgi:site-specific recombinase XerD